MKIISIDQKNVFMNFEMLALHHNFPKVLIFSFYMFKVSYRNTRTRSEICSKLTIKTPEGSLASLFFQYLYGVFIVHTLL